jgi:hypothetical protein
LVFQIQYHRQFELIFRVFDENVGVFVLLGLLFDGRRGELQIEVVVGEEKFGLLEKRQNDLVMVVVMMDLMYVVEIK